MERRVQSAVRVVANQRDVIVGAAKGRASDEDLAIGLHGEALPHVVASPDGRREHPIATEARVQRPVRVVAHDGNVVVRPVEASAADENLAVRLSAHAEREVVPGADISRDHPVTAEAGVESAVGVVAHDHEIVVGAVVAISCD